MTPLPADRPGQVNMLKNLLVAMLKAPEPRRTLRTAHVLATLHAAVRANKGRKFKPNDLPDFDHAAAAGQAMQREALAAAPGDALGEFEVAEEDGAEK